jgi:hypothetical protein
MNGISAMLNILAYAKRTIYDSYFETHGIRRVTSVCEMT